MTYENYITCKIMNDNKIIILKIANIYTKSQKVEICKVVLVYVTNIYLMLNKYKRFSI